MNPSSFDPRPLGSNPPVSAEEASWALWNLQQQFQHQQQLQQSQFSATSGKRRVWIKREGAVPTAVYVKADDLIGK